MDTTRKLITALLVLSILFSLASVVINISLSNTYDFSRTQHGVAGNQAGKIALVVENPVENGAPNGIR